MNNIQDGIRLVAANAVIPEQPVQTPEVNNPTELMTHESANTNPDHIEIVSVDIVNENDDSLAPADDHVPEIPTVTLGTSHHELNSN